MTVQTPRRASSMDRDALSAPKRTDRPVSAAQTGKKKKKDPVWAKLTVVLGALLMMGSGAGIVGTKWMVSSANSAVTQENLLGDTKKH